jgi:integrase
MAASTRSERPPSGGHWPLAALSRPAPALEGHKRGTRDTYIASHWRPDASDTLGAFKATRWRRSGRPARERTKLPSRDKCGPCRTARFRWVAAITLRSRICSGQDRRLRPSVRLPIGRFLRSKLPPLLPDRFKDFCHYLCAAGYALAARGVDTRTLQAFMGHRSIANTVVYTAVADKRIRNIWGK